MRTDMWRRGARDDRVMPTGADPNLSPSVVFLLLWTCELCSAERAAQLSRRIAIANKEEAELRKLIGGHFCPQMLRLIERVVAFSAVSHLLRLDVHSVHYCAAIVMHLSDAAHCVGVWDLYGLWTALVGWCLYKNVVECRKTRFGHRPERHVINCFWR